MIKNLDLARTKPYDVVMVYCERRDGRIYDKITGIELTHFMILHCGCLMRVKDAYSDRCRLDLEPPATDTEVYWPIHWLLRWPISPQVSRIFEPTHS